MALNVMDNMLVEEKPRNYETKEKRKPGRPTMAKSNQKRNVRRLHDFFQKADV